MAELEFHLTWRPALWVLTPLGTGRDPGDGGSLLLLVTVPGARGFEKRKEHVAGLARPHNHCPLASLGLSTPTPP